MIPRIRKNKIISSAAKEKFRYLAGEIGRTLN